MYDDHYGLTGMPFRLTPDPHFWFDSATHRTAMAYLGYGLAQGEGFIVITGDVGAGKTTLVAHVMETLDGSRVHAIRIVSTQIDAEDLLRMVAQSLGLATEGLAKAELLERIERCLHAQANEGRRTLLIVDEAQNLPLAALEELRMLSNFQAADKALLQTFLLGQPEFRDAIQESPDLEQLRQRVIATHHLTAMSAAETEPYVVHRLSRVGWQGNPAFTPDAFTALHVRSGGVPRRLNTLANRVLLYGALEGLATIDGAAVDNVAAEILGETDNGEAKAPLFPLRRASDFHPAPSMIALEQRLDEQEQAVRRVLGLMIDWVEHRDCGQTAPSRSSAA